MRTLEHSPALAGFHEPVRRWFADTFGAPTRAQALGWPAIATGDSTLLLAPTGSGKTLAAFLTAVDRLMFDPAPATALRCRVVYISPLKALAVDVEKNLRVPLAGVARVAEAMGKPVHMPEVAIRTGDTPARERARFARKPADILITTPESLYLILTSAAREALRSVRWVIVDEIHAMVGTKRGTHLALSLERLQELCPAPLQRVGLSATQRPLDEVARFLGGFEGPGAPTADTGVDTLDDGLSAMLERMLPRAPSVPRPVRIVDAGASKHLDLRVEVAIEDRAAPRKPAGRPAKGGKHEPIVGAWAAINPMVLDLIRQHRSTLIFVNSRRLAERLAGALNDLAGEEIVQAHHGSVAREQRLQIETDLKAGRLPAIVATSSLELGIDMGAIDLVIQVEAPPSVSSALQRIGRAGHQVDAPSKGVIIPKYRADLLAAAAVTERMQAGAVEQMRYPRNPLDVLAQQVVAMVAMDDWAVDALERVVRRAAPYADLPRSLLTGVLDMLSGRYPSDQFADLRPRITWDRARGVLTRREDSRRIATTSGGSIPDRGLFPVFLVGAPKGQGRVGELDEIMVFESKVGDTFVLGASSWRIESIAHDRVLVSPAAGAPGRMPFWHGETVGRPAELGRAIGALSRALRDLPEPEAIDLLTGKHALSRPAARDLLSYLHQQASAAGVIPDDRTILVESYRDEMGDWRVCIVTPFGARVHAPWAMALGAALRDRTGEEADILWMDGGIVVRLPSADEPAPAEALVPDPDAVESLVVRQLGAGGGGARQVALGAPVTAVFASRFREAAARALLLPPGRPGKRAPLWQQRKRAADLLHVTARYGSFPIVLETYREILRDVFDMPALVELLHDVRRGDVRVVSVESHVPSPFAAALLFSYVANFMYQGDAPLAERRAQALTVDPVQLRLLLGEAEMRDLLDADILRELEAELQRRLPQQAPRHADALHDLFRELGDLSAEEALSRCGPLGDAEAWLARLLEAGRVVPVEIGGEARIVAAEDASRYRDALGAALPPGIPAALLEPVEDALADLAARYARTHGPFRVEEAARRLGLGVAPLMTALRSLQQQGRVLEGEFRPGGVGVEWCDAEVLRTLRRRSLARLRREVEPVGQDALARHYVAWQGVRPTVGDDGAARQAPDLLDIVAALQGAAIPASALESQVLRARCLDYDPREIDSRLASGEMLWVGAGRLGENDGRVRLVLAEQADALLAPTPADECPSGPVHDRIRAFLVDRGACFFPQILAGTGGGFPPEVLEALWDLVWAGEVTSDTLRPLRERLNPQRERKASEMERRGSRTLGRYRPLLRQSGLAPARALPPHAAGRWMLVRSMLGPGVPAATERLAAAARQMLTRYGIVTRDTIVAENVEGGAYTLYGVLQAMEDAGQVRRGYFVEGLGATQYALPEAVEPLRLLRDPPADPVGVLLAAADPANPYGVALPWPDTGGDHRPTRAAGAFVVLVDGALAAWLNRGEDSLTTFCGTEGAAARRCGGAAARVLAREAAGGRLRGLLIERIDAMPASDSWLAPMLVDAGFQAGARGLLKRR